ncbi:two-component system sensor histidine kinase NtrB [Paenibacillus sp. IITD108]|uniref:two-component system sensor histidine kinase NtrB n=1 Tax=Paenibacillus sp. IITD108 TaxID=3116649 RepID=UPI002F3EAD9F
MLKELLLQFFICLLPVFAYQLWHDIDHRWKNHQLYIVVVCGASIVLCKLTAIDFYGLQLNYQMIPFMTGAIYGGIPVLLSLSIIYAATYIGSYDNIEHYIGLLFYIGVASLLIRFLLTALQQISGNIKIKKMLSIAVIMMTITSILLFSLLDRNNFVWTWSRVLQIVMFIAMFFIAAWYVFFRFEAIIRKKVVYDNYKQLYTNYFIEVEKLQQFIDRSSLGVIIIDNSGNITQINSYIIAILNHKSSHESSDKLLGSSYEHFFNQVDSKFGVKLLQDALAGKTASLAQVRLDQDFYLCTTVSLYDIHNSEISGAALIIQNITELAQLRDEVGRMERLSIVGQMAASITHEIRNPLAVIRGFIQLMRERSPAGQHEYYRIVMEELDRANLIISDFLSLAQNREVQKELTSLNHIISELLPLLKADANLRGQTLLVKLQEPLPHLLLNDREIKQLLLNLVRNGMEAMEDNGTLCIFTYSENEYVYLKITDEGAGISEEALKHLFEPFFTTRSKGTGLGLPLCLSIVEKHNGWIDVKSTEGVGTSFIVKFQIPVEMSAISH